MHARHFDGHHFNEYGLADAKARPVDAPFAWVDVRAEDQGVASLVSALGFDSVIAALAMRITAAGMDAAGASHLQTYLAHVGDVVGRIDDLLDGVRSAAQDYQAEVGNRQGNRINQLLSMWTWVVLALVLPSTRS